MSTFVDQDLVAKYKNHSVQSLKKALKQLKSNSAPLAEIQHASHLLRSTLRSTPNPSTRFQRRTSSWINFFPKVSGALSKLFYTSRPKSCLPFLRRLAFITSLKSFHRPGRIENLSSPAGFLPFKSLPFRSTLNPRHTKRSQASFEERRLQAAPLLWTRFLLFVLKGARTSIHC